MEWTGTPQSSDASNNAPRDGISFASQLNGQTGPQRQIAFFWYDPRPGWDKQRFGRSVFALNKDYKLFRDGPLMRLTARPLEAIEVDPQTMTAQDRAAQAELQAYIDAKMADVTEPPLVDAYGQPIKL